MSLQSPPGEQVAGVICAYNEEANIGKAVRTFRSVPCIEEVVVVDGWSTDRTVAYAEEAGARVIPQSEEQYPGKGLAVETALAETDQEVLVFFDADVHNMETWQVESLLGGITQQGADHAMARFRRKGGRVTELTAKPLFKIFFPEVRYEQPLTGEFATRREVIEKVDIVPDWGIESGLVIDLTMRGAQVVEVDTGSKEHPMKPLEELKLMAEQVSRTVVEKAIAYGRLRRIAETERIPALATPVEVEPDVSLSV